MLEDAVLDESEADEEDPEDEEGHARADHPQAARFVSRWRESQVSSRYPVKLSRTIKIYTG